MIVSKLLAVLAFQKMYKTFIEIKNKIVRIKGMITSDKNDLRGPSNFRSPVLL